MNRRPIVSAFYFPNWHVDPRNEKYHGTGWTEWRVTQYATPRFEGHEQPKVPLWGYEDEADPAVMAEKIAAAAGFKGEIKWDASKPDGMYRKLMDSSRAHALGWKPQITLDEGIERTIKEYVAKA